MGVCGQGEGVKHERRELRHSWGSRQTSPALSSHGGRIVGGIVDGSLRHDERAELAATLAHPQQHVVRQRLGVQDELTQRRRLVQQQRQPRLVDAPHHVDVQRFEAWQGGRRSRVHRDGQPPVGDLCRRRSAVHDSSAAVMACIALAGGASLTTSWP